MFYAYALRILSFDVDLLAFSYSAFHCPGIIKDRLQ